MNYNISSSYFRGYGFLDNVSKSRAKSMEKLSSGYRINTASDDSARSAMSSIMRARIRGLEQAQRNTDSGIDLLNSAESGLAEIASILQRIRELGVQAANGITVPGDRMTMQNEVDQLLSEIDRIALTTEYNKIKLLNNDPESDSARGLAFLVGADHITPDGFLSEIYDTWQMLDPSTNGANGTNNIYRTQATVHRTPTSCERVTGYDTFRTATGSYYTGDIYDSSGNKIGTINQVGERAYLDPAAGSLLPENATPDTLAPSYTRTSTSYNYTAPSTGPTTTYEEDTGKTTVSNVTAASSAVYGKDASGNLIQLSYREYTATRETGDTYTVYSDYNPQLAAFSIDFEKYNAPGGFTNADLYGTGFNSTCATCDRHYSIKFVEGTTSQLQTYGQHYTLEIGVDALPPGATGADLAKYIVDSIKSNSTFSSHYTQYAYSGSTLYAFDNRESTVTNPSRSDSFAAISYEDTLVETEKHSTLKIQVGSNSYNVISLTLPIISTKNMGISEIDVRDIDTASDAITIIDRAMEFISLERTKLGTYINRLQHTSNVDEISAQATTDSESKIHDVDFSAEVLNLTKAQVLEEYGVNSVAEINKMIENVLEFIQ